MLEGTSHKAKAIVLPFDHARDALDALDCVAGVAGTRLCRRASVASLQLSCLVPKWVDLVARLIVHLAVNDAQYQSVAWNLLVVLDLDDVSLLD